MIKVDLIIILPEILISICAMLALVWAVYSGKDALASRLVKNPSGENCKYNQLESSTIRY